MALIDYKEIQEQFNKVIEYSQGIKSPKTDKLFEDWHRKKSFFISCFGGDLIYNVGEVELALDEETKRQRIFEFQQRIERYGFWELETFIDTFADSFFDNLLDKDFVTKDDTVIKKGTKIIKSFKYS